MVQRFLRRTGARIRGGALLVTLLTGMCFSSAAADKKKEATRIDIPELVM